MGHFVYAAKAFDILERMDPDPEYWEGKRGACIGVFQQLIASTEGRLPATTATGIPAPQARAEDLQEVMTMIRNTSNPQVEYITRIIKKWCKDNNIKIN